MDIGDAYLLLERDERLGGSGLLTRPSGATTSEGDILLAVDATGMRRLLVPLPDGAEAPEDRRSRGVALLPDELILGGRKQRYAALVCLDYGLARVFERLVEDALERIAAGELPPVRALQSVLGEWRSFLSAAGRDIAREAAVGLTGELEVLAHITDVAEPLDCWRGPSGALHDFVHRDLEMEVKTTASVEGNTVRVSTLDQLDPASATRLYLVVVHLRESDTAPSLEDRIGRLISRGLPRDRFYNLLARYGYVHGEKPDAHRYEVRSIRIWEVDERFPGLRRSDIPNQRLHGVTRVSYDLALDSAASPLADDEAVQLLRRMRPVER
jgi:hypothetical protein